MSLKPGQFQFVIDSDTSALTADGHSCGVDEPHENDADNSVWDHVDSSIHRILLKEIWTQKARRVKRNLKKLRKSFTSENDQKGIDIYYKLGGYSIIVAVMNKWKKNPKIQAICCGIISDTGRNNPVLFRCCIFAGGIDSIIGAMKNFPNNLDVQKAACLALETLSEDDAKGIMKVITQNGKGGIRLIVKAMETFKDNVELQELASHLLFNVTHDEYKTLMVNAGVVSVLATAIEKHKTCAEIQVVARKTILQLFYK